jgi:hypothetical protein
MFFEQYFKKRGENIEPNAKGEVQVRCPFPHDKGSEDQNASASFNTKHRIYKCFTCTAEGRDEGMSETSFISRVFSTTYENAIKLRNMVMDGDTESLSKTTELLLNNSLLMDYLEIERGFTVETIKRYKLGYTGDGIIYPVILEGLLFDTRTYNPDPQNGEPKIKSRKNATALLFPYDEWVSDNRPTLLTAGEADTLIGRQNGFNAVESTGGEGGIPKILLKKFNRKKVYVVYDCDEAGRKAALRMAFYLKDSGADVWIVDLGLAGTKEDKDLTDYFVKHGKTAEDLQSLLDSAPLFTQEQYQEQKNKEFQLVDLWNIKQSRYSDQYISSRVMQMGHFELPLVDVPAHMEYECLGEQDSSQVCANCPIALGRRARSGEWTLGSENLEDLMELVEVNKSEQFKAMRRLCGIPSKCPNSRITVPAKRHVEKVILAPDVETESESSGFKQAELHAYILDGNSDDGNKYRMYFKRVPHPKDQSIMMIVDKVEDSDNAINAFRVTPDFIKAMQPWKGDPTYIMRKRYEELGKVAVGKYLPENVFLATELVYHGVLDFNFMGHYMKGHPEGLMIGASRTGKSEVGNIMCAFYGLGNVTECKNASVVGLIGGVDKNSNGTFRISWGEIPRNHKGLVFMDEISGLHPEVFKQLTGLRSQRKAVIAKIRKGEAPAKTRLLWVGNPRVGDDKRSRSLYDYATGVDVCLDLFPADEDISRFDFIVLVPEPAEYISPLNDDGTLPEEKQAPDELKQLIRWTWSRNKDQVYFEPYVQKYIEHVAIDLEKDFGSSIKIIGVEGVKKIARIAVAVAACCFSCSEDGETVIVTKAHVDWVRDWLISLYDNDIFRLKQFVDNQRKFNTTTPEIITQVAGFVKKYPMIIRMLLEQPNCPHYNLKASGGVGDDEYRHIMTNLFTLGCIQQNAKGVTATRRLRSSVDEIRRSKPKKVVDTDKPKSFSDKIDL